MPEIDERVNRPLATPTETDTGSHGATVVKAVFTCERELHDLTDFQRNGHFVPRMVEKDEDGRFLGTRPRAWEGSQVHALTLKWRGHQVLRVLADSAEVAEDIMAGNIAESFFGLWASSQLATTAAKDLACCRQREDDLLQAVREKLGPRWEGDLIQAAKNLIGSSR